MKTYLVGGAVRNLLLDLPVHDRDYVVVDSSEKEMLSLGFKKVGKAFPVFLHPKTNDEYALARTEKKVGKGHTGFSYTTKKISLKEDLKRRDFTINALALSETFTLLDYYEGIEDLQNKVIKHVNEESFIEDPLRILRAARFAAQLNFSVDPRTVILIQKNVSLLSELSWERIWGETEKALKSDNPVIYFSYLKLFLALPYVFPELDKAINLTQPIAHHHGHDVYAHLLHSLEYATKLTEDPKLRFSALVHDIGKIHTPISELPHHYGHEDTGVAVIDEICDRLKTPSSYRKIAKLCCKNHMILREVHRLKPKTIIHLLNTLKVEHKDQSLLEEFLLVCKCDVKDYKTLPYKKKIEFEKSFLFLRECAKALTLLDTTSVTSNENLKKNVPSFKNELHALKVKEIKKVQNKFWNG